jgi:hypothetical protein
VGLLIAGVDEAGYGPLLGPLAVGLSVFRVHGWSEGQPAPNFWDLLPRSVAPALKGAGARLVFADSKELKLPNSAVRRHPLTHLERGVLAALTILGQPPAHDLDLLTALGTGYPPGASYGGEAVPLPLAWTHEQIAIACNPLREDLDRAGVEVIALGGRLVGEAEFNRLVRDGGGKGATTAAAITEHFRRVLALAAVLPDDGVRLVCDRLGGRTQYADLIADMAGIPESSVRIAEESPERSRYFAEVGGRQVGVLFQTGCEKVHLPVALASMVAKYTRELAMARFNRYWSARIQGLEPTAGYWQDAKRWLKAAGLPAHERRELVRIA